jgi:hypothetical protein
MKQNIPLQLALNVDQHNTGRYHEGLEKASFAANTQAIRIQQRLSTNSKNLTLAV